MMRLGLRERGDEKKCMDLGMFRRRMKKIKQDLVVTWLCPLVLLSFGSAKGTEPKLSRGAIKVPHLTLAIGLGFALLCFASSSHTSFPDSATKYRTRDSKCKLWGEVLLSMEEAFRYDRGWSAPEAQATALSVAWHF